MQFQKLKNKKNGGFTLIELMVATSIFTVIMLIAMGSLLIASDSARKAQSLRSAMDNVSFAVETMSRSLRVGQDYSCVDSGIPSGSSLPLPNPSYHDCPLSGTGGGAIVFTPQGHGASRWDTMFKRNQLIAGGPYSLQKCDTVNGCIDITSPDVDVQTLKFFVEGSSTTDTKQPSVYIIMKGTVTVKGQLTSFIMQTLASQRSTE
jgi:prepilin-type N-terminal cleavage/methylation domain-containing protein